MRLNAHEHPSPVFPGDADALVVVKSGYQPDTVVARAGRPVRITFHRDESSPCSERVFFGDFGVVATLPQGRGVSVEVGPREAGEYEFKCSGRRCCVGRLILTPGDENPLPRRPLGTG